MEDEDEVPKAVDADPSSSTFSQEPLSEPHMPEQPEISGHGGTFSTVTDANILAKSSPPVEVECEADPSPATVEDPEVSGQVDVQVECVLPACDNLEFDGEGEKRVNEDESVEEIGKVEDLPPVDELEVKNEELIKKGEEREIWASKGCEFGGDREEGENEGEGVEELETVDNGGIGKVGELPLVLGEELEEKNEKLMEKGEEMPGEGPVSEDPEYAGEREDRRIEGENLEKWEKVDDGDTRKLEELPPIEELIKKGEEREVLAYEDCEFASEREEGENEGMIFEESETVNGNKTGTREIGVLPLVEEMELKNEELIEKGMEMAREDRDVQARSEEVEGGELVKAEELTLGTEKEEIRSKDALIGEKMENCGEVGDGQGRLVVRQEEEFKGREEVVGEEEAQEMDVLHLNGGDSLPVVMKDDVNEELMGEDVMEAAGKEMELEVEIEKSGSGGKQRRGQNSKASGRAPVRKTEGEDVCFICLCGGELLLCDRRGCPKAYHPSCINHDDNFFKSKGQWNCGWHLCNKCGKSAYFMCYTCTFSLCKGCSRDAVVFRIRRNKGFCESCMKTVSMIENGEQSDMDQVSFHDKSSWEYLFKDYWLEQKRKLCITSDESAQVKNLWKGSHATDKQQKSEVYKGNNDADTDSDSSIGNLKVTDSKRKKAKGKLESVDSDSGGSWEKDARTAKRKSKRRLKSQFEEHSDTELSSGNLGTSDKKGKRARRLSSSHSKDGNVASAATVVNESVSVENSMEWASKELLEFIMHMKNGVDSVLTQFDVQGLLLEYIKRNELRDPRRKSQIICDPMLQKLFGKPRVGHFEMLKLLESHFLLREDQAYSNQGNVVHSEISQLDADDSTDSLLDSSKSRGRKSRKMGEGKGFQSNVDDYAAVDMHNITLIYLRRNLMEALIEDSETFHDKVVGSFVRIRISGSSHKQDIYRLVQIIGTSKAAEPYRVGKRTTDVMLEILNLDKTEIISIDSISNQDFTEDECKRLRQSIKCGLISRMTVGDVLEKSRELQEVRVNDWLEAEIMRLSHLRDRASEKGRRKELRECIEKLQLLKTPEERQRRLDEIPEVHADPKMDPSCDSEDESEVDKIQASNMRPRESGFSRRGRNYFPSQKRGSVSNESWSENARSPNKNSELKLNLSGKSLTSRREDTVIASQTNEYTWNNGVNRGRPVSNSWEKPRMTSDASTNTRAEHSGFRADVSLTAVSESSQPLSPVIAQGDGKVSETEKLWHYRDPTGKVRGPFSIVQLRKWSNTGYFPGDLIIWRTSQSEDDAVLLTEVLAGRFQKESLSVGLQSDISSKIMNAPSLIDASVLSADVCDSVYSGRYNSYNFPSPTPARSSGGWSEKKTSECKWSTVSSPFLPTNQFHGGDERLPSPTPASPSSDTSGVNRSSFSQLSKDTSIIAGNKEQNAMPYLGISQPPSFTNSTGRFFSTIGHGEDASLKSTTMNARLISSHPAVHVANQAVAPLDTVMNHGQPSLDAKSAGRDFSKAVHPGTGQNPSVYFHRSAPAYVARPETANANPTSNNPNTVPAQLAYGQWNGGPVNNRAPPYGAGYPSGHGNVAGNFPVMPSQNAWRPSTTNMPWNGQQRPPVNPNMGWAAPPSGADFGPSGAAVSGSTGAFGPTPGASTMPTGNTNVGQPGTWGGEQNRTSGVSQWNRRPSFGGGGAVSSGLATPRGQRVCKFHENGHCKKGASCDYLHT